MGASGPNWFGRAERTSLTWSLCVCGFVSPGQDQHGSYSHTQGPSRGAPREQDVWGTGRSWPALHLASDIWFSFHSGLAYARKKVFLLPISSSWENEVLLFDRKLNLVPLFEGDCG